MRTASAALGSAAYDLIQAGTIAGGGRRSTRWRPRVREARAAVEAKKTEVAKAGGDGDGEHDHGEHGHSHD